MVEPERELDTTSEVLQGLLARLSQYPEQSLQWRRAMNHLLLRLQQQPGLIKSSHPNYLDALNRTWLWVSQNIKTFHPRSNSLQESFVHWINGYLYWRLRDLYASDSDYISLDAPLSEDREGTTFIDTISDSNRLSASGVAHSEISGLEKYIQQLIEDNNQQIAQKLELYIVEDESRKLRRLHLSQNPDCHCQLLAQRLLLKEPADRLTDISKELAVNYQTLVSHWKKKCLPCLQNLATEFGYQRNPEL